MLNKLDAFRVQLGLVDIAKHVAKRSQFVDSACKLTIKQRRPYWMLLNLMPYDVALREQCVALLMDKLGDRGWAKLAKYYRFAGAERPADWLALLEAIGGSRGFKVSTDDGVDRAARALLRDFQRGRFGRPTLQEPGVDPITSPLFRAS